jgi:hypothetical protein
MNTKPSELECIHHHLTGIGRTNPLRLAEVANYDGWARLARIELERRRSQTLIGLTDSELEEIASGLIYLEREAYYVLKALQTTAD